MKTIKRLLLIMALIAVSFATFGQVGINTITPNASAALDVESTTTGFLPPRMTYAQMNAIVSPAEGLIVYCTDCAPNGIYVFDGTDFINSVTGSASATPVISATGETWINSNLGATQAATSSTDAASYGDLYQWGRATDGHEIRTSATTSTLATTSVPDLGNVWDGMFITSSSAPYDWLNTQDDTLWQGVNDINNPCPGGYRLPTNAEWLAEYQSWSSQNEAGAFASPLKLTVGGSRNGSGLVFDAGNIGYYWSSTVNGSNSDCLFINGVIAIISDLRRINGLSVRCIKD